jgi:hypothetical protein
MAESRDLDINFNSTPPKHSSRREEVLRYTSPYHNDAGEPALRVWEADGGALLRISYPDGTEFWVDREFKAMWVQWGERSSLENALSYLVGPVLGLLLRLRGVVCLHASAVALEEQAVVFVGAEGAGKSTTAAAFAREGFAVLADDIVALEERDGIFHVLPAYPRVNLWPNSVELLYGSRDALPQIMPDWEKRCLELGRNEATRFEERTLPIGAIYLLDGSKTNQAESAQSLSPQAAMMALVANTYATNFLDARQRAAEFAVLGCLVEAVVVRQINTQRNSLQLQQLCDVIREDFTRVRASWP